MDFTSHANLVLIRRVVQGEVSSNVESFVEAVLVGTILAPLDSCLTRAYDAAIRDRDPRPILNACDSSDLLSRALDCGYEIADTLFLVAYRGIHLDERPYPGRDVTFRDEMITKCRD